MSAKEIKDKVARLAITKQDDFRGVLSDRKIGKWMKMVDADFRHSGLLKSESIITGLWENPSCSTFEDLAIPLSVLATDFWGRRAVVFESGPLQPAVQASMALPGVFTPVEIDGRVFIDGATMNPLPYDVLSDSCDVVIAVDINCGSPTRSDSLPGYFDHRLWFGSAPSTGGRRARPRGPCPRISTSNPRSRVFEPLSFTKPMKSIGRRNLPKKSSNGGSRKSSRADRRRAPVSWVFATIRETRDRQRGSHEEKNSKRGES